MKHNARTTSGADFCRALPLALSLLVCPIALDTGFVAQVPDVRASLSPRDKQAFARFEDRAKEYVKLRGHVKGKLPKLSDESKPEQIEAFKKSFQEALRAARKSAKHGDVFTPEIAAYIRSTMKAEYKGKERAELRNTVLVESDAKGIPLRVNYAYPETKEQNEMAPTVLLKLPQLPKELRYRLVGRNMLLVDRDNGIIVDYMTDALP